MDVAGFGLPWVRPAPSGCSGARGSFVALGMGEASGSFQASRVSRIDRLYQFLFRRQKSCRVGLPRITEIM
jgi:hypothetical protein